MDQKISNFFRFLNGPFVIGCMLFFVGIVDIKFQVFGFWGEVLARGSSAKVMGIFQVVVGFVLVLGGTKIGLRKLNKGVNKGVKS